MKVQEFVEKIGNVGYRIEELINVKHYLPIEVKKTIAQGVIYDCMTEDHGVIQVDSIAKHMSYIKYIITNYTDLEYTNDDYDTMCYSDGINLLDVICNEIGEDEKECARILDLVMDDYKQQATIEYAVAKFVNGLDDKLNQVTDTINKKIESVDLASMMKDVDVKKLGSFLKTYIK